MKQRWQRLRDRIDAMSVRERVLLLGTALLLLWAPWQAGLMGPLLQQRRAQAQELETTRSQIDALNQAVQALAAQAQRDPLAEEKLKLEVLEHQRTELDEALRQATAALVEPKQMGEVLETLLREQRSLTLRALASLAPQPLDLGAGANLAPVYRHGLSLELEGSYLELLRFLHAVEGLSWGFVWDELEIEAGEPQRARMRLKLYTMSLSEGWLGV